MELWHQIRKSWEQDGLVVGSGVTEEDLDAFEYRYSVTLPTSMRQYFQVANGISDMGSDLFQFWALKDVKLVSEELAEPYYTDRLKYPNCFIFVDYLLWCWAYAVELGADSTVEGPIYEINGHVKKKIVAETFTEFMQRYAVNPEDLL